MNSNSKAYLIGGGIGSLAAAALMIRDGNISGENIYILETLPIMGGSLDGAGNPTAGYSLRGGRMLTTMNVPGISISQFHHFLIRTKQYSTKP